MRSLLWEVPSVRPSIEAFNKKVLFEILHRSGFFIRQNTIPTWRKGLATLVPTFVGRAGFVGNDGSDATAKMTEAEAIKRLSAMAEQQGRSFESVLVDTANAELAKAAHRRPAPTTGCESTCESLWRTRFDIVCD
jgi:hypothetical protein